MTILHNTFNNILTVEGNFSEEFSNEQHHNRMYGVRKQAYMSTESSFLSVMPYEQGVWIFSQLNKENINQYLLQSCLLNYTVTVLKNCSKCYSECTIISHDCKSELESREVICSLNYTERYIYSQGNTFFDMSIDLPASACELKEAECT